MESVSSTQTIEKVWLLLGKMLLSGNMVCPGRQNSLMNHYTVPVVQTPSHWSGPFFSTKETYTCVSTVGYTIWNQFLYSVCYNGSLTCWRRFTGWNTPTFCSQRKLYPDGFESNDTEEETVRVDPVSIRSWLSCLCIRSHTKTMMNEDLLSKLEFFFLVLIFRGRDKSYTST